MAMSNIKFEVKVKTMNRPTLEEVKEYFKDAKIVKCAYEDNLIDITELENPIRLECEEYWIGTGEKDTNLWDMDKGYAKILTYKNNDMKYEITKEQVLAYKEAHPCCGATSQTLHDLFPDAFKAELLVGKWYKNEAGSLVHLEKALKNNEIKGYGFRSDFTYDESTKWFDKGEWKEATNEEVFEALKGEAVKLFGDYLEVDNSNICPLGGNYKLYKNKTYRLWELNGIFTIDDVCVFKDGKWATVIQIKEMTQSQIENELGYKIKIV
jgi:hypothetical protein